MFIVQVNDNQGVLKELVHICVDRDEGQAQFLNALSVNISNWDEYDRCDVETILDQGFESFGGGTVMLIDASNCITDDELRDQLTKQPGVNALNAPPVKGEIVSHEELVQRIADQFATLSGADLEREWNRIMDDEVVYEGDSLYWVEKV